jgi:tRNA 2-thiouridine synthesizing protein A
MNISDDVSAKETWDAGDLGCGELVAELRRRLKALPPSQILHLVAKDPGAVEDIPAWCRLTGHTLKQADHPNYLIVRKED